MTQNNHDPIIAVKKLSKTFGTTRVLEGINLDVAAGESLVVIGGSGSGKSVMIKCMLGLLDPDPGASVCISGQESVGVSEQKRQKLFQKTGVLFQGSALFDSLPVWENVCFALLQQGIFTRHQAKEHAVTLLKKVGLEPETHTLYPSELSGGMQRRVALARAIATDPEIIFFDEPTTGLDPIMSAVIHQLIRRVVSDLGATAVSITHHMSGAHEIADRVAFLYKGRMEWIGPRDHLMDSGNPYVDQFVHGAVDGPIKWDRSKD